MSDRIYIELLTAAETLATYTQGFSENRSVQEAKEVVQRARTDLASLESDAGRLRDVIWRDVLDRLRDHDIDWEAVFPELFPDGPERGGCICGNWYHDAPCECETLHCGGKGQRVVREGHDPVMRPCPGCPHCQGEQG